MQSQIMFLMPPFLLRAFTMGVLWPSLGRILVNVQADNCTQDLVAGPLAHTAAAAVTAQIMDAMDRDNGKIGYRTMTNATAWHGDPIDWEIFECLTYDEEPDSDPSVRVSKLEWVTCKEGPPSWSKPTVGFFVLDAVLSSMFVLFIFVALRAPFVYFTDEIADNEIKEFREDLDDGVFPKGTPQHRAAKSIFSQFEGEISAQAAHDDDVNDLLGRPLMLIDFIVSDPVNCMFVGPVPLNYTYNDDREWVPSKWSPFGDALVPAFIHWGVITSVGMPLVLLAVLLGCKPMDEYEYAVATCSERPVSLYILYFLWAKDAFGFLYCVTHYLQLDGKGEGNAMTRVMRALFSVITVPSRHIALTLAGLTAFFSLAYIFNIVAWMVLTILLKPSLAITAITLLAVPVAYAFFATMALMKMKEAVVGSDQVKDTRATLKKYGLRTQDIIMTIITGLMLIITLVCWVVLGFALFTDSLDNPASIVPALGMLGGAAQGGAKDVTSFQKKIGKGESAVTGNFTHTEPESSTRGDVENQEGQEGQEQPPSQRASAAATEEPPAGASVEEEPTE